MSEEKNVECPKCGTEMEQGFVATWYMYWTDERRELFWKSPPKDDVVVKPGFFHIFDKSLKAYRCKKCKLVLFNYADVPVSETPKSVLKTCVSCRKEIPIASDYCPSCGVEQTGGINT